MILQVSAELLTILDEIFMENKSEEEWAQIESDDMFQTEHYSGGFDATEMAFCFSYHQQGVQEYWFQLTLSELNHIISRRQGEIEMRPAS